MSVQCSLRFRNKYHPVEALGYQNKLNDAIRRRAGVFLDLLQSGWLDKFTLTAEQGDEITKLLDAGEHITISPSFFTRMILLIKGRVLPHNRLTLV